MHILSLLIGSFFLAACAVGPDYSRPDLSSPASFRMAGTEAEGESFANLPWWELLQDQALHDCVLCKGHVIKSPIIFISNRTAKCQV